MRAATVEKREWHVRGRVTTLQGDPINGAQVHVETNLSAGSGRNLQTNLKGEFETDFPETSRSREAGGAGPSGRGDVVAKPGKAIRIRVATTRDGYIDARENVEFESTDKTRPIELVMRRDEEDAQQLSLHQLVSQVGQQLRSPGGGMAIPPPAAAGSGQALAMTPRGGDARATASSAADCEQGARELLDLDKPENAVEVLSRGVAQHPESVECHTLLGLALLNWGSWFGAEEQLRAAARLTISQQSGPKRPEPFLVLGVLETWRGELRKAAGFFLPALDADPANPLVLQELGRCFVLERNAEAADAYLMKAIQQGAPVDSHLLRAQALLEAGNPDQAETEMAAFLGNRKPKQLAAPVRYLWTMMEQRVQLEATGKVHSVVDQPVAELLHDLPELKGLEPAEDQEQLGVILKKVNRSVQGFFSSFPSTTSVEQIRMERLHRDGKVAEAHNQDFQYLVLAENQQPSRPSFEEYRTNELGSRGEPGGLGGRFMVTQGFAAASLHFHPAFRHGSRFRFLGRQLVEGREYFILAFAQRPEAAEVLESFRIGQVGTVVLVQGLAWVDASTYQIWRMRTDLLKPLADIHLERQTTDIGFKEVTFTGMKSEFWLPRQVAVTVDWNGRLYRNWHTYSDFKLFNVESRQGSAKAPAAETPAN
jgi:Flp pilus assembly protein TadD